MEETSNPTSEDPQTGIGLRDRKKAKRRSDIMRAAAQLFAKNGFDGTTLAEIANEIGVSPPTVANYFGSKDNILSALIFEGTAEKRHEHRHGPRLTDVPFEVIIGNLLFEFTKNTMAIAGKRVWRYAEARNIRQPNSEFEKKFAHNDDALRQLISKVLADYDIVLRNRAAPDPDFLANLFFDRWTQLYFAYIKNDRMTMQAHETAVRSDVSAMIDLLFDDTFAENSPLKNKALA